MPDAETPKVEAPKAEVPKKGLRPSPMQRWFAPLRVVVQAFFLLFGPIRARGAERMPDGGVLVLINHLADVDPFAVLGSSRRPIRFMGKRELFEMRIVGFFMRAWGNFPVSRGEADRAALKEAAEVLKAGEAVGIFPEGELSASGTMQELKAGVALIARMAPCPVICVALRGTNRILPYGKLVPRPSFRCVDVVWGEPRHFDKESAPEMMPWAEAELRRLGAP
ncbi:1-acyl-sn-glycerol-3-phosphate acyltransferase [bacterium]|nr:MAG: 1-acyl-sn-glycerol-3-phosphate acyltransferase [bacterium]